MPYSYSKGEGTLAELTLSYTQAEKVINFKTTGELVNFLKFIWDKHLMSMQEQFYCIFLDVGNNLIAWRCIATGTTKGVEIDFKILFGAACQCLCGKIVVAHNHPSGSLVPSKADIEVTDRIIEIAALFGINVIDHFIITPFSYYSIIHKNKKKTPLRYKLTDPFSKEKYLIK